MPESLFNNSNESFLDTFNFSEGSEQERVQKFNQTILQLEVQRINDTPIIETEKPKDFAIDNFILENYPTLIPTAYYNPQFEALFSDGTLNFSANKSQIGKSSIHGVIMGDLSSMHYSLPVVIKPFLVRYNTIEFNKKTELKCLKDYYGNVISKLYGLGHIDPVGIIFNPGEVHYSVSVLQRPLETFDSIDWSNFLSDIESNEGMVDLWRRAAMAVAQVHSLGDSFHGDLLLKNIATNPKGEVFLIDWESGNFLTSNSHSIDQKEITKFKDLNNLIKSMISPFSLDILSGSEMFKNIEEDWWTVFKKVFYDEYRLNRIKIPLTKHDFEGVKIAKLELAYLDVELPKIFDEWKKMYILLKTQSDS